MNANISFVDQKYASRFLYFPVQDDSGFYPYVYKGRIF